MAQVGVDVIVGSAFLEVIGLQADSHYSVAGDVGKSELDEVLNQVRVEGAPLKVGSKAAIRLAFRISRALAGIAEPPPAAPTSAGPQSSSSTTPATSWQTTEGIAEFVSAIVKATAEANKPQLDTVTLAETVSQVLKGEA